MMKLTAYDRRNLSEEPAVEPEPPEIPDVEAARTIDALTDEEVADIRERIEQRGWTRPMVAWRDRLSVAQVFRLCERAGIERPIQIKTTRGVRLNLAWDLLKQGHNPHEISKLLEQNYQQVYMDCRRLRKMTDRERRIVFAFEHDLQVLKKQGFV